MKAQIKKKLKKSLQNASAPARLYPASQVQNNVRSSKNKEMEVKCLLHQWAGIFLKTTVRCNYIPTIKMLSIDLIYIIVVLGTPFKWLNAAYLGLLCN